MNSTKVLLTRFAALLLPCMGCGSSPTPATDDGGRATPDTGSNWDGVAGEGSTRRPAGDGSTAPSGEASVDAPGDQEMGATGEAGARPDAGTLPTSGTSITDCQALSTGGATYVLANDVSAAGTCFSVTADDITLNLNGHKVTYGTSSQATDVVAGIMMVECWESAWGGTITTSSGAACGTFQGFTVGNGTINQGSGTLQNGSHVIRAGGNGSLSSGPTVFGVTSTWSTPYSQFVATDYGNDAVPGAAVIHDNVLTNDTSSPCPTIACRDQNQGSTILLSGATATATPAQIYNNTVNGGPQGAISCDAPGCVVHDNLLNPGTASSSMANDFSIWCWSSDNIFGNVILTPLTANSESRGIEISGVVTSTVGANVHNNTVAALEKPNDAEYGGCQLGGAYGIQFDDNPSGATAQDNAVTGVADECWGTGLRLTDTETTTNVSQNNTYVSIRKAASSPTCEYIGGGAAGGCAHAVALDSPTGFLSKNDSFRGDSDILFFDWDGASDVTFVSPIFSKGTTNPSPGFHTFVFRNGGTPVENIHVQDATFGVGTGPTDTDLPEQGGNNQAVSLFIDWSQSLTVTKASGGPVAGAVVTYTDTLGTVYTGTTDASGVVVVVVPQYRLNNDSKANGVEDRTPYSRSVTASGCTESHVAGIVVSSSGKVSVVLNGC
jgi:hypothetical protein